MIIEPRKAAPTQKDAININFGDDQKYYNTQLELLKEPGSDEAGRGFARAAA